MEDFASAPWLRRLITVVLLAGLVLLGERAMEPFVVPLLWAAILAFVSWPAYERLLRACGGRSIIAALLMTAMPSQGESRQHQLSQTPLWPGRFGVCR